MHKSKPSPAICFLRMSISFFRLRISTSLLALRGPSPVWCCSTCTVCVDSATVQVRCALFLHFFLIKHMTSLQVQGYLPKYTFSKHFGLLFIHKHSLRSMKMDFLEKTSHGEETVFSVLLCSGKTEFLACL